MMEQPCYFSGNREGSALVWTTGSPLTRATERHLPVERDRARHDHAARRRRAELRAVVQREAERVGVRRIDADFQVAGRGEHLALPVDRAALQGRAPSVVDELRDLAVAEVEQTEVAGLRLPWVEERLRRDVHLDCRAGPHHGDAGTWEERVRALAVLCVLARLRRAARRCGRVYRVGARLGADERNQRLAADADELV